MRLLRKLYVTNLFAVVASWAPGNGEGSGYEVVLDVYHKQRRPRPANCRNPPGPARFELCWVDKAILRP
jgi:hypothetical protein